MVVWVRGQAVCQVDVAAIKELAKGAERNK
jgi:hypothetical protein